MNTKAVMTTSACVLVASGSALTFAPDEILGCLHIETNVVSVLLLQILGALYFGFGMLNWMTKGSVIGGIYNRPIAVANFSHFAIAGLALVKGLLVAQSSVLLLIAGIIYAVFAVVYGVILFRHPLD